MCNIYIFVPCFYYRPEGLEIEEFGRRWPATDHERQFEIGVRPSADHLPWDTLSSCLHLNCIQLIGEYMSATTVLLEKK